jgi:hypothetical protein
LTLLSSTPRTGAPPRISSGSGRWQPRAPRRTAARPLGGQAQRPALGGRRRSDHDLREADVDLLARRGEELQPGLKGAGASTGEEGQPSSRSRRRRHLPWHASMEGATERRWRRRNPGGFAPSAKFRRTESTHISGEYSLPGRTRPQPLRKQTPQKRVRPIRVGWSTPTKHKVRVSRLVHSTGYMLFGRSRAILQFMLLMMKS